MNGTCGELCSLGEHHHAPSQTSEKTGNEHAGIAQGAHADAQRIYRRRVFAGSTKTQTVGCFPENDVGQKNDEERDIKGDVDALKKEVAKNGDIAEYGDIHFDETALEGACALLVKDDLAEIDADPQGQHVEGRAGNGLVALQIDRNIGVERRIDEAEYGADQDTQPGGPGAKLAFGQSGDGCRNKTADGHNTLDGDIGDAGALRIEGAGCGDEDGSRVDKGENNHRTE